MKKFIDFCKLPLLCITGGIFGVFMLMLIIVCCVPHGKSYVYSYSFGSLSMEVHYTFKKGNVIETKEYVNGKLNTENSGLEGKYKIIDKNLLVENEDGSYSNIGKIDAFKIKLNLDEVFGDSLGGSSANPSLALVYAMLPSEMTCNTNIALRTTSIVFMSISGVLFAACLTLFILDKKGIIKYKQKASAEVATASAEAGNPAAPQTEQTATAEAGSPAAPQTEQNATAEAGTPAAPQTTDGSEK